MSPPPQGSCIWIGNFLRLLNALPSSTQVHCAWIQGHTGFQGNEVSNYFINWVAHALLWHRNLTLPPPLGSITLNKCPILRVPSAAKMKAGIPKHEFADLHPAFSSDFYKRSSFFPAFTFEWASGNFCMATYEPHWNLAQYLCPVCSQNHRLDPFTFTFELPFHGSAPSAYVPGVPPPPPPSM